MRVTTAVPRKRSQPFVIEELDLEEPRGDEVLVDLVGAGICHTDSPRSWPLGAGVVERVAWVGPCEHVVVSFLSYTTCGNCLRGMPAYWPDASEYRFRWTRRHSSTAPRDSARSKHFFGQSSLATYTLASDENTVKRAAMGHWHCAAPLGCGG